MTEKGLLKELIEDYQKTHKCDIDTATYYTMAILVDAVASGMSPLEGMYKRIFEQKQSPWHTGTPTDIEEDERWSWNYAIVCDVEYDAIGLCLSGLLYKPDLERGVFSAPLDGGKELTVPFSEVIAWQKIEPYKEKEDGHTD